MTASDRLCAAVLVVALGSFSARTALADSSDQRAVQLFEEGRRLAREGHCAEAVKLLEESVRHAEGVGPLLNLGQCYETLGKPATALRWFAHAETAAAARNDPRQKEAAERRRILATKVSTLTIVPPPGPPLGDVTVRLDGEVLPATRWAKPIDVDPGAHTIETRALKGGQRTDTIVVNANADRITFTLSRLDAPPSAPAAPAEAGDHGARAGDGADSAQRTVGYVVAGAGVVGVVGGGIFGALSLTTHSDVVAQCPSYPTCDAGRRGELDELNNRAQTFGTVSTISLIAGGVLLAGGLLLVLTAR